MSHYSHMLELPDSVLFSPAPNKKQATDCTTHLRKPNPGSALLCSVPHRLLLLLCGCEFL
ncbi:hypothetical protein SLEP1_g3928 [Rubroshorea leprosula]|uniref:Uncharacterized protein n=1 Tax=Rubroshorea leprosula TaxID=152421 RepID=A0AAV5HM17_9ROSI|nr:hypothetical protein SLEP1_g3928 [Rubroshorea leprosula]